MTAAGAPVSDAARFVQAFAEGWAGRHERLLDLLHPDVRLIQPMMPPISGRDDARTKFLEPLLRLLPDMRIEVTRWSAAGDLLFIEWIATATLAGQPLRWTGVDRFVLAQGQAVERVAYFDAVPLIAAIVRHPSTWLSFVRSRVRAT